MRLILALLLLTRPALADIVQPPFPLVDVLAGTAWQFREIVDLRRPDSVPMFLTFQTDGAVTGHAGCNAFHADYDGQTGDITFGPVHVTRSQCDDPLMTLEAYTLDTLEDIAAYTLSDDGQALRLTTRDGRTLLLARVTGR
jgi:heat shock protein HslJ